MSSGRSQRPIVAVHRVAGSLDPNAVREEISPSDLGESGLWHLPDDLPFEEYRGSKLDALAQEQAA